MQLLHGRLRAYILVTDRPLVHRVYLEMKHVLHRRARAVLVDVGANTGSFALLPALLPELHVVAFEPLSSAFELLDLNVRANGIADRVFLRALALSDHAVENATLQVPKRHLSNGGGISTLSKNPVRLEKETWRGGDVIQLPVSVSTLDRCLSVINQVDLLKIDVEGWELYVLRGGRQVIRKHRPKILLERRQDNMAQGSVTDQMLNEELEVLDYQCTTIGVGQENQFCIPTETVDGQ